MNASEPWSKRYSAECFKKLFYFLQEGVWTASFTRKPPPLKELRPLLCAIFVFAGAVYFWRGKVLPTMRRARLLLRLLLSRCPGRRTGTESVSCWPPPRCGLAVERRLPAPDFVA
jgi:hypothetical protein